MPPIGLALGGVDFKNLFIDLSGARLRHAGRGAGGGGADAALRRVPQHRGQLPDRRRQRSSCSCARSTAASRPRRRAAPITRDCPFCLSPVPLNARRCAHCTSELDARVVRAPVTRRAAALRVAGLPPRGGGVVRGDVPRAHARPGAGLAGDPRRALDAALRAHRLGQDAGRVPVRHRPADVLARARPKRARCRVLYVSPLRALAVDVERNLRAPLAGIARVAERRGDAFHVPDDRRSAPATRPAARARAHGPPAARHPDHHAGVAVPRAHLAGAGDAGRGRGRDRGRDPHHGRLPSAAPTWRSRWSGCRSTPASRLQRIGLSATQRPLEEVARYLGGGEAGPDVAAAPGVASWTRARARRFDLRVEVPVEDMSRLAAASRRARRIVGGARPPPRPRSSIWPAIHPRLLELIRAHRSTLIFVNSRRLAERLAAALNELAGEELARAHHGSLAREQRVGDRGRAQGRAACPRWSPPRRSSWASTWAPSTSWCRSRRRPRWPAACSASAAPATSAGAVSRGVIFPKYRGDLLATAAITRAMQRGRGRGDAHPAQPARRARPAASSPSCAVGERTRGRPVRPRPPRRALRRRCRARSSRACSTCCPGRYPSDEFAELRPRLIWDRTARTACARARARAASPSPTPAPSPTAASTACSWPTDGDAAPRGPARGGQARGRAGRGDGLREPRGRRLRARRVELAHRRRSPATACWSTPAPGRAGEDAVLARRPPRAARSSWGAPSAS